MAKPEIRLKGFEGEWVRDSFSNSFQFLKNNSLSRAELNYEKGRAKNVHYGDVLIKFGEILDISCSTLPFISNNEIADKQAKESFLQNGDIVFADAAEDNTVGKCSEIQGMTSKDRVVSGLHTIPCRPTKHFEKGYLGYYLNSNPYHNQLLPMIQGTKVSGISKGNLCSTTITYPNSSSEQQSIADYFKSLDSMIQGATKKIASLKQMKQACLVSMFPQAGETTPRVRFKGFKGEWLYVEVSECLSVCKDRNNSETYGKGDVLSVSDDYGVVNQIELLGRSYAGKSVANYRILRKGHIVYTKSPLKVKPFGIIKVNKGKDGIVSTLYAVYTPMDWVSAEFINYYFEPSYRMNKYIHPLVNKGAKNDMKVSDENVLKGKIYIPKEKKEQEQIASFFRSLDSQISLQELRLEKLKQIKSACLDKMFV